VKTMLADDDFSDDLMSLVFLPEGAHRANSDQREAVLAKTIGVMRRRRMAKRIGLAAALVGCYAAGLLTMSLVRESNSFPNLATATAPLTPVPAGGPERENAPPAIDQREPELAVAKLTPYDRLRQLGDRQLSDETDIPGAIRTYRRALQVASNDQRAVSVDHDSWLLMAIKSDQFQP
jgi:hypothetical protein